MSYLSIALQRAAESTHKTQTDIANLSGVSRSFISRLMTGDALELSDKNFTAILKAFAVTPQIQAELVAARCMDVRVGPGSERVEISIKGHTAAKVGAQFGTDFPEVKLPHETEKAFAWLRGQCPINRELERHLVGYAKMLGMK
jgi:transcriptional regulator with XRE-family HTH domain